MALGTCIDIEVYNTNVWVKNLSVRAKRVITKWIPLVMRTAAVISVLIWEENSQTLQEQGFFGVE